LPHLDVETGIQVRQLPGSFDALVDARRLQAVAGLAAGEASTGDAASTTVDATLSGVPRVGTHRISGKGGLMSRPEGFDPNQVSFDQGVERLRSAAAKLGLDDRRGILTSRDPVAAEARKMLMVSNIPGGFTKWQLPVMLDRPSQLFITVAEPGATVTEHSHDEGDGIRFIAGGSIIHDGVELTAGDWMFIPAGVKYGFQVGDLGALMCYCYSCCCAGRADLFDFDEVVDPPMLRGA